MEFKQWHFYLYRNKLIYIIYVYIDMSFKKSTLFDPYFSIDEFKCVVCSLAHKSSIEIEHSTHVVSSFKNTV